MPMARRARRRPVRYRSRLNANILFDIADAGHPWPALRGTAPAADVPYPESAFFR